MSLSCVPVCFVAFALIGLFVMNQINSRRQVPLDQQHLDWSEEQKHIYAQIVKERWNIFLRSFVMGIFVSLVTIWILHYYPKKNVAPRWSHYVCYFLATTLFVTYIAYNLSHKSDYMLLHMNSREQIGAWLKTYRSYQLANYFGILLGILVYILGCYISTNKK